MGLLSIGGALLGGLLNRSAAKKQQARNEHNNDPATIRAKFEAAGFNPRLGIQGWSPSQSTYAPRFGDSVASAAAIYDEDKRVEEQLKIQKSQLEQENQRLEMLAERTKLRPSVPGIYGRTANVRQSVHGDTGGSDGAHSSFDPARNPDGDPRRDSRGAPLAVASQRFDTDPGFSDAEAVEERYGDVAQNIYGSSLLIRDFWHNAMKGRAKMSEDGTFFGPYRRLFQKLKPAANGSAGSKGRRDRRRQMAN